MSQEIIGLKRPFTRIWNKKSFCNIQPLSPIIYTSETKSPTSLRCSHTACLYSGCCSAMLMWANAILSNCTPWHSAKCQKRFALWQKTYWSSFCSCLLVAQNVSSRCQAPNDNSHIVPQWVIGRRQRQHNPFICDSQYQTGQQNILLACELDWYMYVFLLCWLFRWYKIKETLWTRMNKLSDVYFLIGPCSFSFNRLYLKT